MGPDDRERLPLAGGRPFSPVRKAPFTAERHGMVCLSPSTMA
jgi:hypothetical protein